MVLWRHKISKHINTFFIISTKMKPKCYKKSDEEFIEAVRTSKSIRECLLKLGLVASGGNYACFHRRLKELNLSISHFQDPRYWNKGRKFPPKRDIQEYFNGAFISSNNLKLRLLREGYKEHKCECCGLTEWMGKSIPIELDHINGNSEDNRLENLQILCPNCHAQTITYRGKNKFKYEERNH